MIKQTCFCSLITSSVYKYIPGLAWRTILKKRFISIRIFFRLIVFLYKMTIGALCISYCTVPVIIRYYGVYITCRVLFFFRRFLAASDGQSRQCGYAKQYTDYLFCYSLHDHYLRCYLLLYLRYKLFCLHCQYSTYKTAFTEYYPTRI